MRVKHYELIKDVTIDMLKEDGFTVTFDNNYIYKKVLFEKNIVLWIGIKVKDFSTSIEILDEDFLQPYIPFYKYIDGEIELFPFLNRIIEGYHSILDNLKCFKKVGYEGVH